ncbi:MAG TPA: hypothetical protein VL553_09740 [Sphingomicrobium sp.]|jgi:hypothetical protein|nr:hypothetical protein [Sphingomicrobium sp.]
MPRNRLLAQIDEELLHARESLKFWRDQMILLDHTDYQVAAKRQVMHREAEIERLLEAQETLLTIELAGPGATASSPSASRSSFR